LIWSCVKSTHLSLWCVFRRFASTKACSIFVFKDLDLFYFDL